LSDVWHLSHPRHVELLQIGREQVRQQSFSIVDRAEARAHRLQEDDQVARRRSSGERDGDVLQLAESAECSFQWRDLCRPPDRRKDQPACLSGQTGEEMEQKREVLILSTEV
jgi:hypothetical protein